VRGSKPSASSARLTKPFGHAAAAICALIVAVEFLEAEMDRQVSHGLRCGVKHGRFNTYSG
jgi:hypothetical protein